MRYFWQFADCISNGIIWSEDDASYHLNTLHPRLLSNGIIALCEFNTSSLHRPDYYWRVNWSVYTYFTDLCIYSPPLMLFLQSYNGSLTGEWMLFSEDKGCFGFVYSHISLVGYLNCLYHRSVCRMANSLLPNWISANHFGCSNGKNYQYFSKKFVADFCHDTQLLHTSIFSQWFDLFPWLI